MERKSAIVFLHLVRTCIFLLVCGGLNCIYGQQQGSSTDVRSVLAQIDSNVHLTDSNPGQWWDAQLVNPQRNNVEMVNIDIETLMFLAVKYSRQIKIAAEDPRIRQLAITEADSNFDWVRYLNSQWHDKSLPTSTTLIAGAERDRLEDHTFQVAGGARKTTRYGGLLDISQQLGWQDSNSTFFIPANQATGQLTISYSHPLLRGSGVPFNNSLVVLARLDAGVASAEFMANLQNHLLEVTRAYWALYRERAVLTQQVELYLKTDVLVNRLRERSEVDTSRSQSIAAQAALEARRADLIRGRNAVVNAETRLRGLINAPELGRSDLQELIPMHFPDSVLFEPETTAQIQLAIQNRPEVAAAIRQLKAGATRLGVAENELLPQLNLITQGYANGLQGDSDFGGALDDQFSGGDPSYSVGFQWEIPVGNRMARTRLSRRQVELRQLNTQYEQTLATIETEVDMAIRELKTAHSEIGAKGLAMRAARSEAITIEERWQALVGGSGTSGLNLESLLRAQERVFESERDYVTALLTYNLAETNLKKSTGTLLQSTPIDLSQTASGIPVPAPIVQMAEQQNIFSNVPEPAFLNQKPPASPLPVMEVMSQGVQPAAFESELLRPIQRGKRSP